MKFSSVNILLALAGSTAAQGLAEALQKYPETTTFAGLLNDLADDLANRTTDQKYTVLVPTNKAFESFTSAHQSIQSLSVEERRDYLRYHVLITSLNSTNFSSPAGLTVPTLLKNQKYNNRTAGVELTSLYGKNSDGQVLFIAKDINSSSKRKFRVRRQTGADSLAQVRAGISENATITAVNGQWDGGSFHFVDQVLQPPAPCTVTIRAKLELAALDNALNRSGIWPVLDTSRNVTCLAPNSAAFKAAGDPDQKLNQSALISALTFHTLPMPLYSSYLKNGMELQSLANMTVRVSVNSSGTWFNDAKVVEQNVLTNNGLVHVLDKVMSPLASEKQSGGGSSGGSSGGKPSMAPGLSASLSYQHYVAALFGVAALLLIQ